MGWDGQVEGGQEKKVVKQCRWDTAGHSQREPMRVTKPDFYLLDSKLSYTVGIGVYPGVCKK